MGDLLIRNVPPLTMDALKARAKRKGRSVQAEALDVLEEATKPAGAALVEWLKENRDPSLTDDDVRAAIAAIRETRDER